MTRPVRCMFLLLVCITTVPLLAGEFQDDLKARRDRLMQQLGPESMLILWSAPARAYSRDIEYEYRQDSDLYYLTGVEQAETVLALMPGNAHRREILFVKPPNPSREHWTGHVLTAEDAAEQTGIRTILVTSDFGPFLDAILARRPFEKIAEAGSGEFEAFFSALAAGRARVALLLAQGGAPSDCLSAAQHFAARLKAQHPGIAVQEAGALLRDSRMIKTPYELKVLRRSVNIAGEAQKAGMKAARSGKHEYEVKAAIEYVYKSSGAWGWSYPPIVGSGPNATVLHYSGDSRRLESGDLLLVDAACNYQYLTGDITRTYPAGGKFTPAQKDIYRIVLQAQDEMRKAARPGATLTDIHGKAVEVIRQGLFELGLLTDARGDQYRTWFTHGSTHYVGIDVHDVGVNQRPLQPGMTFAMEPGIYIRVSALETLPNTPEKK